jgi:choline monooxygenase
MTLTFDTVLENLEQGRTLPASWYHDREIAVRERDGIFRSSWQYAGCGEQLAEPGSFFATRIGPVPVVIVRDKERELRGFVNVCRHRWHVVARGSGRRNSLQCPYHAWTYGLDGRLRSAPRSEREPGFEKDELSLVPAAVAELGPLIFVNPDPGAPPLADVLGDLPLQLAAGGVELARLRLRRHVPWSADVNWKASMENYLECYHCQVAHPGLSQIVDVSADNYRLRWNGLLASQSGDPRDPAAYAGEAVQHTQYHLLFPNTTFNVELGPMNMSVDITNATSPRSCAGFTDFYFPPELPDDEAEQLMAFAGQVNDEDSGLVEGVQEGLSADMVPHGRLMTNAEHQIAAFQRLVFDAVAAAV